MKYFAYLFAALDLYAGIRFFLNAMGILQTSKYGNGSNVFFAVTLTTCSILAFYLSIAKGNHGTAVLACIAPWAITIVLLLLNMLFGDYK